MPPLRNTVMPAVVSWTWTWLLTPENEPSPAETTPVTVTVVPTAYGLFWTPLDVLMCRSTMLTANAGAPEAMAARVARPRMNTLRGDKRMYSSAAREGPGLRRDGLMKRPARSQRTGRDLATMSSIVGGNWVDAAPKKE